MDADSLGSLKSLSTAPFPPNLTVRFNLSIPFCIFDGTSQASSETLKLHWFFCVVLHFQLRTDRWSPPARLQSRCPEQHQSQRQCDLPFDPQMPHNAHATALTYQKCCGWYEVSIKLTSNQVETKKCKYKLYEHHSMTQANMQLKKTKLQKQLKQTLDVY